MNFNREPYYDDFDPANKYYKILFKPGLAVQARELNQIQSTLQRQINGASNHIFKKNTMVIPGGVVLNTGADLVEVNSVIGLDTWVGQTITNAPVDGDIAGYITAIVLGYGVFEEVGYLYVKYYNTQTTGTTKATFSNDVIRKVDSPTASTLNAIESTIGKVATIAAGVYYTKDIFVDVDNQSVIVEPTTSNVTNCQVVLQINESIVTSDTDESLLDNAQGTPNYAAPGADRYKVELILQKYDLSAELNDEQFITLMRIENDVTTLLNNNTEYAELMKTLARRTYDANGNFIVSGLNVNVNESSDDNYVWANVGRGRCYLGGYEYNQIADVPIALEKPRANYTETPPAVSAFAEGLTYFYVAGGTYLKEIPTENTIIQLLNAKPGASSVATIGYAVFKDLQYVSGTVGSTDIYKMFFDIVDIEKGYGLEDIGGYKVASTGEGSAVLHQLQISNQTGAFSATQEIGSTTDSSQLADIYYVNGSTLYVVKKSINLVPNTDTIKNNTVAANAFLVSSFVSNYSDTSLPLIKVDDNTIQTLIEGAASTVTYSYVKKFTWAIPASNGSSVSQTFFTGSGEEFEDLSNTDYNIFITTSGSEAFVDYSTISSIATLPTLTSLTLTIPTGSSLRGKTIWVYATVKVNQSEQSAKSEATATIAISTPSKSRNVWMSLKHQDVIEIVKIVDSGNAAVAPNISTDTDVTSKYVLDSGNTPGFVGTGMIKLKKGATPPVGQLGVQYKYYSVSAQDYVSVDSYGDFTSGDLTYIGGIADVVDSNRNVIKTRQYIDFRTTTSSTFFKNYGEITSGSAVLKLKNVNLSALKAELETTKYVVGPHNPSGVAISSVSYNDTTGDTEITLASNSGSTKAGIYYVGLNSSLSITGNAGGGDATVVGTSYFFPKDGAKIAYTYTRFKPRKVLVYINRDSDNIKTDFMDIEDLSEAVALRRNAYKLPLAYVYMEPYTVSTKNIQVTRFENPVYQMLDIHDLKGRIERNEYYTTLALNVDLAKEIVDANSENLTTSSKGFWSENFMDPTTQAITSPDFTCTVYDKSFVSPGTVFNTINLQFDDANTYNAVTSSGKWQRTGNAITLPYTEQRAFGNDKASKFNNLNPYNVMNWVGKMVLNPSVDNWVDIQVQNTAVVVTPVTPPPVVPAPPVEEIVTEINNLRTSWGKDSAGGYHAITFDWKTNLGRTGRVNTDWHLSPVLKGLGGITSAVGKTGYDGTYAKSLINKKYNAPGVKEYLNAGTHFDQKPPSKW